MVQVFENIFTPQVFRKIQGAIMSSDTPWFFVPTPWPADVITHSNPDKHAYTFAHVALDNNGINSPLGALIEAAIISAIDRTGDKIKSIDRIRIGLIPWSAEPGQQAPHVDVPWAHRTGIIYINTADGDTVIYNEKYNPDAGIDTQEYFNIYLKDKLTVHTKFAPVENTLVLFDGLMYHNSSSPVMTPRRVAINFNYTVDEV